MTAVARRTWRSVPEPEVLPNRVVLWWRSQATRDPRPAVVVGLGLAAVLMAAAEPWLRTRSITVPPRPALVLTVAAAGSILSGAMPPRWWWARLATAAVVGAVCAAAGGVFVGVGAAVSAVVADWTVRRRPPLPVLPAADPDVAPTTALVVAAATWWGTSQTARTGPVLVLLLAGVVTMVGGVTAGRPAGTVLRLPARALAPVRHHAPRVLAMVAATVGRVAMGIGRWGSIGLRYVTFSLLSVPAVLLPWAFQRVLWIDPLSTRRRGSTRWLARQREPELSPGHPWMVDPLARPDRPFRRWRVAAVAVAAVPVLLFTVSLLGTRTRMLLGSDPAAFAGQSWWRQHDDDLRTITRPGVAWNPYMAQHVQDVELETITVRNGERVSWSPPAGGKEPRLTVWMYGGSTTFGFGQRDDYTVPSELAKLAAEAGYTVDVVNKGVPGDLHADEARRFAWDITGEGTKPDVVVFYDGVNDVAAANERNMYRTNGDRDTPSLVLGTFRDEYRRRKELSERLFPPAAPSGGGITPTTVSSQLDATSLARRAVSDYERSRLVSRATALATGTDVLWFWQPTRVSRPPVDGEPTSDNDAFIAEEYGTAQSLVAQDVVNLTDVFDGHRQPLFYDDIHTNEAGARIVAEGIFARLRPALDRARTAKEGP